jgi:hypothetical protein
LELLATQRSMPGLKLSGEPWLHERGYRELCGLEAARSRHARVDRLWVIDDRGINDGRIARLEELRRRVRSAATPNRTKRVMLKRGNCGSRRTLVNKDEVCSALMHQGFEIVSPEEETARSVVEKLANAEIAICVEGSVQNHCLLAMPAGSTLLTIQPPDRFNAISKTFADAIGMHWGFVVAEPDPNGFRLPTDHLFRTIDELMRLPR